MRKKKHKPVTKIVGIFMEPEPLNLVFEFMFNGTYCTEKFKKLVLEVYKIAHVIQQLGLVRLCVDTMLNHLRRATTPELLVVAYDYPNDRLQRSTFEYFEKYVIFTYLLTCLNNCLNLKLRELMFPPYILHNILL
jgi:hypothetical protein